MNRRSFMSWLAAVPVVSRLLPPGVARGGTSPSSPVSVGGAQGATAAVRAPGAYAPFQKPADLPPVKYLRDAVPTAKVPEVAGERYAAVVPDTCDVAERARLFVDHYLNSITVPELAHEPFNRGRLNLVPARLSLDTGSYDCALPKFREALPLLRMMSGSRRGLAIDRAWAELTLKCIGPDGLFYDPRIGRPWDQVGAYQWVPQEADYRC
ncbi:MAG: hypothetical protein ACRD2X_01845, partial [Vicinamibacteraceae bacterium]